MRDNPTQAEIAFAGRLEAADIKFTTQKIIAPYIVDFYLPDRNLIIELDGPSHAESRAYDEKRDRYIRHRGYKLLRLKNRQAWTCSLLPFGVHYKKPTKPQKQKVKKRRHNEYKKSRQPGYHILDKLDDLVNVKS